MYANTFDVLYVSQYNCNRYRNLVNILEMSLLKDFLYIDRKSIVDEISQEIRQSASST